MDSKMTKRASSARMSGWDSAAYAPLFFHFGIKSGDLAEGPPLVCLNGGIMVDSGSEGRDFLLTCQDRYPVYAALGGMRTLLFVRDSEHVSRYRENILKVEQYMKLIASSTETLRSFSLPIPLFVPCDIESPKVCIRPDEFLLGQLNNSQFINAHVKGGIYLNQLSPSISSLISQVYGVVQKQGIECQIRLDEYDRMATSALKWHDKASYIELLKTSDAVLLPSHVPTAMFSSGDLKKMSFESLGRVFEEQTRVTGVREFFVKSGMDADGEVSVVLNRENFEQKKKTLSLDISVKITEMNRSQSEVKILVQPRIERFEGTDGLPASVGITYNIVDEQQIEPLAIVGHVYEDPERKTFIGSYQSDFLTRHVLKTVGESKIQALLSLFARQGYRGPINLDAVRNTSGEYIFIYDCNPRLGASFPGLILKSALKRDGLRVQTFMTLGYHGRVVYPDINAKLAELDALSLLYTRDRQRGVLPIPSMVRKNSFDLILINMEMNEVWRFIDSGRIGTLSDEERSDLQGVYV
jgi:hypothetical protein